MEHNAQQVANEMDQNELVCEWGGSYEFALFIEPCNIVISEFSEMKGVRHEGYII